MTPRNTNPGVESTCSAKARAAPGRRLPRGVAREVEFQEHVEGSLARQRVGQRVAVDRVNRARVAADRLGLVALQLPDEVPVHVEIGELCGLGSGLLVAVLTDVAHTEADQLSHQPGGMELGHDDASQLGGIASCCAGGIRDLSVDACQAVAKTLLGGRAT
jgi:hypothetical protein